MGSILVKKEKKSGIGRPLPAAFGGSGDATCSGNFSVIPGKKSWK